MSDQNDETKGMTKSDFYGVIGFAAVWIVIITNPSKFFVGLGIAPVATLTQLFGMLLIPCLPTYFIARLLAPKLKKSLHLTWIVMCAIVLTVMTIGLVRRGFGA